MKTLVVNAGSSTLKLSVIGPDDASLGSTVIESPSRSSLSDALGSLPAPDAVGHRVVHGGREFDGPTLIDSHVRDRLKALVDLAPLHQPPALSGIDLVRRALPDVPSVACFDTAFHTTLPAAAFTYALPAEWSSYGLRRFGFHGLSYAYASRRAAQLAPGRKRLVICHLGAGASLAAVRDGKSVDTTMGFTPLEGLVMAKRPGNVDAGLLIWLQRHASLSVDELDRALNHRAGLLGLCGDEDMREVLARSGSGDQRARLALDVYLHRLRSSIAAMAASLGGLDALVFTAGVGEHSPEIRARTVEDLEFLGLALDPEANAALTSDGSIAAPGAAAECLMIEAREDLQIAREVRALLS